MRAAKKKLWISSNYFGKSGENRGTGGTMKKTEKAPFILVEEPTPEKIINGGRTPADSHAICL